MNHIVLVVGAMLLSIARQSHEQPLCGGDQDTYTSKLCLTVLEEILRRNHNQIDTDYAPELYDSNLPFVDRGSKRQDVDHVFLRFGR